MKKLWQMSFLLVLFGLLYGRAIPSTQAQADQIHVVQPGETLFSISLGYNVTIAALQTANQLTSSLIYAGQSLIIPGGSGSVAINPNAGSHTVQPGETLALIANRYGITWPQLQSYNQLPDTRIYSGQILQIPGAGAAAPVVEQPATAIPATPQPAAPVIPLNPVTDASYVVQPGDTLAIIASRYGLNWLSLAQANGLTTDYIYSGQVLQIPGVSAASQPTAVPAPTEVPAAAPAPTALPAPSQPAAGVEQIHVVKPGETLFLIGLQHNLSWTTIQAANGLAGTVIYSGQSLRIPASDSSFTAPVNIAPAPPAGSGKRFLIDISQQMLYAYEGDTLVRSVLVSTGRAETPTVLGTYSIQIRLASTRMTGCCPYYDLPNVPWTQYFYKGYGIHGTYWHSNFGTPMSHGCVNLPTDEAKWAYDWATYGTPVIVQQ